MNDTPSRRIRAGSRNRLVDYKARLIAVIYSLCMFTNAVVVRGTTGLWILLAVSSGLLPHVVSGQALAHPSDSVFGIFGQPTAGHDSIRITKKANGKIAVAIKLYYASGHTCQLNKDGEWREDHVTVIADSLEPGQACRLNISFQKDRILLKDEGYRCTPVYCGTRGTLDNVSLPKINPNKK